MPGATTKVDVVHRWLGNPVFRVLLRGVIIPSHFMNFSKVIEVGIVSRYVGARTGDRILDVGCGFGEQSARFAPNASAVYGVDVDQRSIEVAASLYGESVCFVVADAAELPFRSEYFNKVVSVCALEHFANDEQAIEEMNRVLMPNGKLVVSVDSFSVKALNHALQDRHRTRQKVVNYYGLADLAHKLEKHGFQIERSEYCVGSTVSSLFFELQIRNYWMSAALFPLAYPLAVVSDSRGNRRSEGYLLVARACKGQRTEDRGV